MIRVLFLSALCSTTALRVSLEQKEQADKPGFNPYHPTKSSVATTKDRLELVKLTNKMNATEIAESKEKKALALAVKRKGVNARKSGLAQLKSEKTSAPNFFDTGAAECMNYFTDSTMGNTGNSCMSMPGVEDAKVKCCTWCTDTWNEYWCRDLCPTNGDFVHGYKRSCGASTHQEYSSGNWNPFGACCFDDADTAGPGSWAGSGLWTVQDCMAAVLNNMACATTWNAGSALNVAGIHEGNKMGHDPASGECYCSVDEVQCSINSLGGWGWEIFTEYEFCGTLQDNTMRYPADAGNSPGYQGWGDGTNDVSTVR